MAKETMLDLCRPCAELLGEAYVLTKHSGGVNNKVTCDKCGKKRFGATYLCGKPKRVKK